MEKAEVGRAREEKSRREKIREEKEWEERRCRCAKREQSRETLCFSNDLWLKRRVRSHLARWEMKSCMPLWREAHLQVKKLKTPHVRSTFGSWDVEKVHAVAARSTFGSQHVQNTPCSDHFSKLMSKKFAPLWREAHFQVKMHKTPQCRNTFGSWDVENIFPNQKCKKKLTGTEHVQMLFRVAGARDCAPCQKWAKREGFVAVSATTTTLHSTPPRYNYNYTTLH